MEIRYEWQNEKGAQWKSMCLASNLMGTGFQSESAPLDLSAQDWVWLHSRTTTPTLVQNTSMTYCTLLSNMTNPRLGSAKASQANCKIKYVVDILTVYRADPIQQFWVPIWNGRWSRTFEITSTIIISAIKYTCLLPESVVVEDRNSSGACAHVVAHITSMLAPFHSNGPHHPTTFNCQTKWTLRHCWMVWLQFRGQEKTANVAMTFWSALSSTKVTNCKDCSQGYVNHCDRRIGKCNAGPLILNMCLFHRKCPWTYRLQRILSEPKLFLTFPHSWYGLPACNTPSKWPSASHFSSASFHP